ncbi:transporter substrate-binding domain-containing protein [Caballeronia sp. J97]|uniref:transporter substrate-binding domain-containing protein n=1 Tax=Caballeronia sp. J97 TaxID=2805429 RepID=UPI002AB323F4|nr:transporter substrate-binding domain-containing protein [Caballeronia sp. J97]
MKHPNRLISKIVATAATAILFGVATFAHADVLENIKQRGKIIVATQAASPYFAFMDSQGKFKGSDVEVAEAYAKSLGVGIEFIPTTNDSRIAAIQTGKADIIFGALTLTAERAKAVQFSRPYEPNLNIVAGPPDKAMPDYKSIKSIGFSKGSTMDVLITAQAPPGLVIRRFDDEASTMQAYLSGQVDAVGCSTPLLDTINKARPGSAQMKFVVATLYIGAGMKKGEKALNESVNAFIEKAEADGTLAKIYKKWSGLDMAPLAKKVDGVPFTVVDSN